MSRWFRFYDDAMNDPKLLRLSDAMFRAWMTLLCIASKHEGKLPPADDIALMLRLKTTTVATWITELSASGLLDNVDGVFAPHNWDGRQYKSDSSNERVKRHRQHKRNVTCNVTDTVTVTAPETDTDTEQKKDAAPVGAHVVSITPSPEKIFFDQAVQFLGTDARSLAAKLLKAKNGNVLAAHQTLLTAMQKSEPRSYLGAVMRGRDDIEELRRRGEAW